LSCQESEKVEEIEQENIYKFTTFLKTYSNDIYGYDTGHSVQQTTDGGYIIVGGFYSIETGRTNLLFIKTDSLGTKEWDKSHVNGDLVGEEGYSVQQTTDGGYIITGSINTGESNNVFLYKTDSQGNEEWAKTFGEINQYDKRGYSVQQTTDGGYIITGISLSEENAYDVLLIKTDSQGNEEWNKTFGENNIIKDEKGYSVQQTTDGGYIIVGHKQLEFNNQDVLLIKVDSQGNEEWNKMYGGDFYDYGYSVQQTTDGGYIITGSLETPPIDKNLLLIKTDSEGNLDWYNTFVFYGDDKSEGKSVQQTTDGGYIIGGTTASNKTFELLLVKVDSKGTQEWFNTFYNHNSKRTIGYFAKQTNDNGYIIVGTSNLDNDKNLHDWDILLVKTHFKGELNN